MTRQFPRWKAALVVAGLGLFLFLYAWSPWGLWERDEGRYASIAQEMLDRGDFVTPHFNGAVFFDKPPLVYWVTAACLGVFGRNAFGARLSLFLFASGTLLLTFAIGRLLYDRRRAIAAVLVLASSIGFYLSNHVLTLDPGLAFFVMLTMYCFLRAYRSERAVWHYAMYAAVAGAVLAKGPIGALLPGMTVALFLVLRRDGRGFLRMRVVTGGILALALAAPWFVLVSMRHPEFLEHFFLRENLERFTSQVHHRSGGWYFYLLVAFFGLFPWTLIVPSYLLSKRAREKSGDSFGAGAFLFAWFAPTVLFFSTSQSKLPTYILPVFPAAALWIASVIGGRERSEELPESGCLVPPSPRRFGPTLALIGLFVAAGAYLAGGGLAAKVSAVDGADALLPLILELGLAATASLFVGYLVARRGRLLWGIAIVAVSWMLVARGVLALGGGLAFYNETQPFAAALRAESAAGAPLFAYRCMIRGLPFYTGSPVTIVEFLDDDLKSGAKSPHDPRSFGEEKDFFSALRGDRRVFAVVQRGDLPHLQSKVDRVLFVLATCRSYDLVSNEPGAAREAKLASVIGSGRIDYAAVVAAGEQQAPGSTLDMIDIERVDGSIFFELEFESKSGRTEVRWPITAVAHVAAAAAPAGNDTAGVATPRVSYPSPVVVSGIDEAAEERPAREHLFRMRPPEKPEGILPAFVFRD